MSTLTTADISAFEQLKQLFTSLEEGQQKKFRNFVKAPINIDDVKSYIDKTDDEQSKKVVKIIREHRKEKSFIKESVKKPHLECRKDAVKSIENQAFGLNKCYKIAVNLVKGKAATKTTKEIKALTINPKKWIDPDKKFHKNQLDFVMKSLTNTCKFLSQADKDAGTTKTLTPKMLISAWVRASQMDQSKFGKIAYS